MTSYYRNFKSQGNGLMNPYEFEQWKERKIEQGLWNARKDYSYEDYLAKYKPKAKRA